MTRIILSLVMPALMLAYFWKRIRANGQENRLAISLLVAGTGSFYLGFLLTRFSPSQGSGLQLFGACLFFSGVALHIGKPQADTPQNPGEAEEDKSPPA